MKESKALQVLRKHQAWRRDGKGAKQQDPLEVGEAIDVAIAVLETSKRERAKRPNITDVDAIINDRAPKRRRSQIFQQRQNGAPRSAN